MSEFLEAVRAADAGHAWRVLDAFMDALRQESPTAYEEVLHSLKKL